MRSNGSGPHLVGPGAVGLAILLGTLAAAPPSGAWGRWGGGFGGDFPSRFGDGGFASRWGGGSFGGGGYGSVRYSGWDRQGGGFSDWQQQADRRDMAQQQLRYQDASSWQQAR
jgi:hypothetical protein